MAPDPDTLRSERVEAARAEWTRHLVELGGPNTLLWYRDLPVGTVDLSTAHLGARTALLSGERVHLSELVREPQALEDARRRVERVHDTARRLESEHGIRTAFLGIGTASWTVVLPNGRVAPREPAAPVFVRSCRTRPVDARRRDWVLEPGDELEVNPALVHYLASGHGIDLDTRRLEALAVSNGTVDPYPAYAALAEACAGVPDLSVDPRVVLTTFPYHKVSLVADLTAQADGLARHDVVAALAGHPDVLPAVSVGADVDVLAADPDRDVAPLDADTSQREAVEAVRTGSHLLLRTPPGTGASQTVANLVAALSADGQRVLLVSPKRASVVAVRERLASVGLDDLVLDLPDGGHGRTRAVRELLDTLERRLEAGPPSPDASRGRRRQDAAAHADRAAAVALVDDHLAALHGRRDPWATTLFEVQEEVSRLCLLDPPPRSRVRVAGADLARLDRETLDDTAATLVRLAGLAAWDGDGVDDPWFGTRLADDDEAEEARHRVERLAGGLVEDTRRTLADVFRGIHLPAAPTVLDWQRVLSTVGRVRDTLEMFRPEVFDIPLGDLVAATAGRAERRRLGSDLGVVERWRIRRQARSLLRPGRPPADLHAALREAEEQRHAWRELAGSGGRPEIPVELDRAQLAHATLVDDLEWLDARLPDDGSAPRLVELDLVTLRERVASLAASVGRLGSAPEERRALDRLEVLGLRALVDDLRDRRVPAERVDTEVRWVWWCSLADEIGEVDARVAGHDAAALSAAVATLAAADADDLAGRPDRVRRAVAERVAQVRREHPGDEAALRREAGAPGRPAALPDLLREAPHLLTAIRPCWAMSPLTVPSVLPPGEVFDVVVVEEASLVAPAEAVAAISRARRVVLVGDRLQLPPAPFVVSAGADAPEDADTESVLDALDEVLPSRELTWHYRAFDERLVSFVDRALYDGRLVTFPGTSATPVVRHVLVDGFGVVEEGEGAVESTTAEVERVVALVLEHARTRPDRSLVVVALSPGHRRLVEAALRDALARLDDRDLAFFDESRPEPFAVLDPDGVQGEAWDDVIVTVGFGKTPHGRVLHRFGPIGTETGHRRLAVALSRARRGLTVVSSISAEDLDPDRLRTPGARLLRDLLADVESPVDPTDEERAEPGSDGSGRGADVPDDRSGDVVDGPEPDTGPNDPVDAVGTAAGSGSGGHAGDSVRGSNGPVDVAWIAAGSGSGGHAGNSVPGEVGSEESPEAVAGSVVLRDLARRLRAHGLTVHERVGTSSTPIDLAVEDPTDPGRLLLAVEGDGPAYAAVASVRDRDRLRPEQLALRGWRHLRVWSTDVFRDPARDVARVLDAVGVRQAPGD